MRQHRDWWQLAFVVLLWFGATFVYFGAIGKYSDDWWTTSRRTDGTGIDWSYLPWSAWPYFWRPLHLGHVWLVNTVFWQHDWVGHLELALVHAAVCLALYRLLLRLGCSRRPAIAAVMLFGTCPLLGEAIVWFSASCNAIGSFLLLITLSLGCRFGASPGSRSSRLQLGGIALLSFATACFYEPAAAGLAAMPLVVWIACSLDARGMGARERVRRAVGATVAAGLPCALYVALLTGTAPPSERGAAATIGDPAPLLASIRAFISSFVDMTVGHRGREIVLGSVEHGVAAVRAHPLIFVVVVGTAVAGFVALVRILRNPSSRLREQERHLVLGDAAAKFAGRGHLLLIGVVLMLASLLPFVAQHNTILPCRSLYVPLLGFAFVVAGMGNALRRAVNLLPERGHRMACFGAVGAVGTLAILGQLGLIGMQDLFRSNARRDDRIREQLAAMSLYIPTESAFMVLAADDLDNSTSRPAFNSVVHTALRESAAATPFVRLATRRNDVRALTGMHGGRALVLVDQLSSEGVRDTGIGGQRRLVPWSHIVPIYIDAQGTIRVVEALTIVPQHESPSEVRFSLTERLADSSIEKSSHHKDRDHRRFRLTETPSGSSRVSLDVR